MANAVGILEVYGLTTAFVAADAACKAADVTLENFDKNKPANAESLPVPLLVTIKIRGNVAAVKAGLEAAKVAAEGVGGVVCTLFQTQKPIRKKCSNSVAWTKTKSG